jgi:CYTH domain-containing protein
MGVEIERKYLVNHDKWKALNKPAGKFLRQGYLLTDPDKTIRVRYSDEAAYLTIKGLSIGATRSEFEYEIPINEAQELLDKFSVARLAKIRYNIKFNSRVWEVDEFLDDNFGLIVAEIELSSETESFDIPGWIDKEVTAEEKYYNSNLSIHPFKNW